VDGGIEDGGILDGGADGGSLIPFGERCTSHSECETQICLPTSTLGSICTRRCSNDCPADWVCKAFVLDGNRIINLCVPFGEVYCQPCAASQECPVEGDRCSDFGGATYCSRDCAASGACPPGYECRDVPFRFTAEGLALRADGGLGDGGALAPDAGFDPDAGSEPVYRQCVPQSGLCPGCIDHDGDRYGVGADCLGPDCDDRDPTVHPGAVEVCDGKDNDCNGIIDDPFDLRTDDLNCGHCGRACDVAGGQKCCEGDCVDVASSALHCGACGQRCSGEGLACCSGSCRSTLTEPSHCGGCGMPCQNDHGALGCEQGQCRPTCVGAWGDCDGNPRNGCETPLDTIDHCGACDRACTNSYGTTRCVQGRCEPTCSEGHGDCDGNPQNGCESNLAYSAAPVLHCGGCSQPCVNDHGTTSCEASVCKPVCNPPTWGDCDGIPRNGCETDLLSSPLSCGVCGRVCGAQNAVSSQCLAGQCRITCSPGYFDCNGLPNDGCEANLTVVTTCNSCQADPDCPAGF
jgi:hypothetical protein